MPSTPITQADLEREAARLIGKDGMFTVKPKQPRADPGILTFPVHITASKVVFGRVLILIEPVGGSGNRWVSPDGQGLEITD